MNARERQAAQSGLNHAYTEVEKFRPVSRNDKMVPAAGLEPASPVTDVGF